jgi:predicted O-linked N-acetylglucosamine transferase (SPINDLY family)
VRAHQHGEVADATDAYADVLREQPGHAPALYLAGVLARDGGDAATAIAHFRAALAAAPGYVDARVALAGALIDGSPDEAAALARDGIAAAPEAVALLRALGRAELDRGDASAAAVAFDEALKRDRTDAETHYNHGVALQTARRPADAARAYQRALALQPDMLAAHFNLGVIFDQQGKADAAIAAYANALQRAPDHVAAFTALADALLAAGRVDAWYANFERFERQRPDHLALAVNALEVCAYRADFAKLAHYLDGLRDERFTAERPEEMLDALQQLLYLLHFFDVDPGLIGSHARTHDALARRLYGEPWPRRAERRPGRLRIGYLSGDFRNHVMGKMMWEVLRRHDRARFDVFGYATTDARDEWTARFESVVSRFDALGALPDRAAARRIADDDLDVLVDLSTHTKGARPGILALKPARVQITHVASAGTLAMSAIDFKLTDRCADPRHDPAAQIEAPLVMDGCVYPYRHVEPAASGPGREALRIPAGAIVIGAFVTPLKLSQRCLELWREVMARVPHAVLAFSPVHPALRKVFQNIAAVARIEARRIVFVPQGRGDAAGAARYRLVDFVLDALPYGGVNGTLEALDMGVPVVTLAGRRHAERTSCSILTHLGVTDTIAETGGDYVALAVRLATDPAFMRSVRERIAAGLRQSPLTDMDAHTRHLEAAYVRALEARAPEALAGSQ